MTSSPPIAHLEMKWAGCKEQHAMTDHADILATAATETVSAAAAVVAAVATVADVVATVAAVEIVSA